MMKLSGQQNRTRSLHDIGQNSDHKHVIYDNCTVHISAT